MANPAQRECEESSRQARQDMATKLLLAALPPPATAAIKQNCQTTTYMANPAQRECEE